VKLDWEARNIVDILREHHADLIEASVKLSEGGDFEGAYAIDDDIIIIEEFLEKQFSVKWYGKQFLRIPIKG
tara:strand:- start:681 stop:896 length:216 start_codon:yes stop_codon:yes gene_type:complete